MPCGTAAGGRPRSATWIAVAAVVSIGSAAMLACPPPAGALSRTVLSNEVTYTRWANTRHYASVRAFPSPTARRIAGLHFRTEDGLPEVYVVLASQLDSRGDRWYAIRLPMRPNGRIGWVRPEALGPLHLLHTRLIVDRHRLTATLYNFGRRIWFSRIGVGKWSTPTPAGRFWIREKFRVPGGGSFGPYAFGTSAYSNTLTDWFGGGVIGIHGTDQPGLIPGRPSHGCIRVPNPAILRLARLMPAGTPLLII
jgi:hypothetical protein